MHADHIKNVIAITASVSTILQFLTGTLVCQKIVNKASTGDISSFPFVCGFLSTSLWLRYGFLIEDSSLVVVNTIGATLHIAYVMTFYAYSIKKSTVLRQFLGSCIVVLAVLTYSEYETNWDEAVKYVGLVCCLTTILFFAAPLASLRHVIKVRSAESLPFPIILATLIVSFQWFIYGVLREDIFIQFPNFLGCVLSGFQLSLFWLYPKSPQDLGYSPVAHTL